MENLRIALKLTLICFIAVLLLSIVNLITCKKIENNSNKVEEETNRNLFSQGVRFEKSFFKNSSIDKNKEYYYKVYDKNNTLVGYVVTLYTKGYGGDMKLMVAMDNSLVIVNAKLLTNSETPGLGKAAEKPEYMKKFIGTNTKEKPIPLNKSMLSQEDADSITGATITFKGIANGIQKAVDYILQEIK